MAIGFNVGGSLGTVVPDKGLTLDNNPKVLLASFGDGYEHRIADGINNLPQTRAGAYPVEIRHVPVALVIYWLHKKKRKKKKLVSMFGLQG